MESKHREQEVMEAIACPVCGAKRSELCWVNVKSLAASPRRPILHQARCDAWRDLMQRLPVAQPGGPTLVVCAPAVHCPSVGS
jgi:hypothetical protein